MLRFRRLTKPRGAILRHMKVEEIAEAVARLPPDQLARFRRWFTAFEAGRANHQEELDSAATKLGRLAGRALAELKKRERILISAVVVQWLIPNVETVVLVRRGFIIFFRRLDTEL